jgi:tetratricopeptide (TPR) repeat protein
VRSPSYGRADGRHLRQVLLFAGSVLLPALVLLFFVIRVNRQENELRERRAEEARQRKAEEIGRGMAAHLAEAEQAFLRTLSADPDGVWEPGPAIAGLVFAGRIEDGALRMPWDRDGEEARSAQDERSRELVLRAQQTESSTNDPRRSLPLLNRALSQAASDSQKGLVKLHLGSALVRSGRGEEAIPLYEEILDQPALLTDEYGIPLALYAADRLSGLGMDAGSVLDKLERFIKADGHLAPEALYFVRDVLESLEKNAAASRSSDLIGRLRQAVEGELEERNRILSLRAIAAGRLSRRDLSTPAGALATWEAHGDVPWLVRIRDGLAGKGSYLLAFDAPEVLASALETGGLAGTFPGACRIVTDHDEAGYSPGSPFSGFRFRFDEMGTPAWSSSSPPFPMLYWLILVLVVGFTGFGMYLIWRDVRRELAVADMKSQFAASVSHELKTPLTAIRMFAEALAMGVRSEPEAQREYLRTIISESERLSRLLGNVLDFSKIEQGTRTYRFEPVSLEAVVRDAAKAMAFALGQKGFDLRIETDPGLPSLRADKDALEQAVLNLLDNAMKYSGRSREIHLKLRREADTARIEVTDRGIGISEEDKKLVFARFFRAPGSENRRIPGAGLGLAIVSHIVEAHRGRVEVDSRAGQGSTFSIVLPVEEG